MTNALKLFGKEMVDLLYFDTERPTGDPIVSNPGGWKFPVIKLDSVPLALPDELIKVPMIAEKTKGVGSNNWVVHGSKTATGSPILCNDPHLNLSFPSIWYVVHLNTPSLNVMGASLPGSPGVIIGYNDSVAWAVTNAQRDLVDWYKIQYQDEKHEAYLSNNVWKPVKKRIEKFIIRGKDPFYDTVNYTHHGPVVYDNGYHIENEKSGFAFRWLAHDGSEELTTLYMLNRAKNYEDYRSALDHWSGPSQNFAFASSSGDIAMRVQGKFPVRRKDEGKYVLDGTKTSSEWKAFIPYEQNVMVKNPARGFVSSANQFPADSTYPYYVRASSYETFRNKRINEVLTANNSATPQAMMKLQNDNFNVQAAESLPLMLSLLEKSALQGNENQIVVALSSWDYYNTVESMPASYYELWWNAFYRMLWDEMEVKDVLLDYPNDFSTISLMRTRADLSFYDIQSTSEKEDLKAVVNLAFRESAKKLEEWEKLNGKPAQWADYKNTLVQHLLRIAPLSKHVRVGGNSGIVNAAGPRNGPSWRMIVSLEKSGMQAWGVYPGGQSGNPGSPFYDNMLESWSTGKYYKLNFPSSIDSLNGKSIGTTTLSPAKK
jgi:penicillin amidase